MARVSITAGAARRNRLAVVPTGRPLNGSLRPTSRVLCTPTRPGAFPMTPPLNRRSFLQASAAVLAAPTFVRGRDLNSKIDVAVVGCGGRGGANMNEVAKTEYITALCDVNGQNLDAAAKKHKD